MPRTRRPLVIAGALGLTGLAILDRLARNPWPGEVRAIVRPGTAPDRLTGLPDWVQIRAADLSDREAATAVFAGAGTVVHVAGAGLADPVVPAAFDAGARHVVAVMTTSRFSKIKPGARELAELEDWLRARFDGLTVLRPTMIYGSPRDGNLSRLLGLVARRRVVPVVGGGTGLVQPVHAHDVAQAAVAAARRAGKIRGRAYNIAGQAPLPFRDLVRVAGRAVGRRVVTVPVPLRPTLLAMSMAQRLGLSLPVNEDQVLRLSEDKTFDWSNAAADLGFDPLPVERGLRLLAQEMGLAPSRG